MARPKKVNTSDVYKITLSMGGELHTAEGATVHDALNNLVVDYTQVKTKGTITLEKGTASSSKLYYLRPLRRIVASRLRKVQVAKDLEYLLK